MSRGHAFFSITDSQGNLQGGTTVSVCEPGTQILISGTVWNGDSDNTSAASLGNPFITPDGNVSFFLDVPQRVDIGYQVPGQAQAVMPSVDVSVVDTSAAELTFPGSGTNSTQLGSFATAAGDDGSAFGQGSGAPGTAATAIGQSAAAAGTSSTATGQGSQASGLQSSAYGQGSQASATSTVAAGQDSIASGNGGTALGASSLASGTGSTALGASASAPNTSSTAIGAGATTSEDQQIMLGTPSQYADIPNFATLPSIPSGIKFRVYVNDSGHMLTRYHYPLDAVNLLSGVNASFDGSIGAWAPGLNCAAAYTAAYSQSGAGSMIITQTAGGESYASSPAVPVTPGIFYVANIWEMQLSSGSATEFEVWLAFYNSSSILIGSASAGPQQAISAGIWTITDVRAQAPAGSVTAELWAGVPSGGSASNAIYADSAGIFAVPQVI